MLRFLFRLLFRLSGWKVDTNLAPGTDKCVVIAAPHTSNWDTIFGIAAFDYLGIPSKFALKSEMFFFPFKYFLWSAGGISINRKPKKEGEERPSLTEAMAEIFKDHDRIALMISPEGTRKKRPDGKWKSGFYYIALAAKVPIGLGYVDHKTKMAGIPKVIHPSGDYEKDMKEITDFYRNISPKYPEKFFLDKDFA